MATLYGPPQREPPALLPVPDLAEGAMPTIREVTWVFRTETGVRLAMLQTGEADLALRLDLDQIGLDDARLL
jgi:ABC-type transport system substrate-binding protein